MPLRRYLATRQMPQMVHLFTLIHLKLAFWAIYQPHCSPGSPVRTHSAFPQLLNVSQAYHLTWICQQRAIQKKNSSVWFDHFCCFYSSTMYFAAFLSLSDRSQVSSGYIEQFHFSRALIWAQAQPSSSIRSGDMTQTMASIAPKMPKKTTTFMVVLQLSFLKMSSMIDFLVICSCFTKVLRAKNRWETLSTLTFDLVVRRGPDWWNW